MSTITINVLSSTSTSSSGTLTLPGNFTSIFYPGYKFNLTNQQGQLLPYVVASSSFTGGATVIDVDTTVEGSITTFTFTPGVAPYVSGNYFNVAPNGGTTTGTSALINVSVVGPGTINAFTNLVGGTGYLIGNYVAVPFQGGAGTGATALIAVNSAGSVYSVSLMNPGTGYMPNDVLTVNTSPNGVLTISTILQPTGGTVANGVYPGISLTGGTGTGAVGTITVAGSQVSGVVITTPGSGYVIGDVLGYTGASVGTGGTVRVATLQTYLGGVGSGFSITVASILTSVPGQVSATLVDGGIGYTTSDTVQFNGPFGQNSILVPTTVTTNELGTITLFNQNPMFTVNQSVYVINELPSQAHNHRWFPATPQAPAVQSGTVLQSTVTASATDMLNTPQVQYVIRLSGQSGTQTFMESNVYVDKPTAIAAYEALSL